jgi:hypothetical protein
MGSGQPVPKALLSDMNAVSEAFNLHSLPLGLVKPQVTG